MEVLNELRQGLNEERCERAMDIELRRSAHKVALQPSYPVFYWGEMIGNLVPDMLVVNQTKPSPDLPVCILSIREIRVIRS